MVRNALIGLGLAVAGTLSMPSYALAQSSDASEMSAEELEALFAKQKTRGLVLAPIAPKADDTVSEASAETEITSESAAGTTYVALAPEEQVNIQISFDFDSSALRNDQKPKLATLCQVMKGADVEVFRIVGHTDASGSASYNESLSLLRAQEVKRFLVGDCGIAEGRLEAVGVGENFPLDAEDPDADVNRRVEFQALS